MIEPLCNIVDDLDRLILSAYPYPIAINYERLLKEEGWEQKTRMCIRVFEFGLRAISLGLISQYLLHDIDEVNEPQLNVLLKTKISRAALGTWNEILFTALSAYRGKRHLFFMPELYDFYWDASRTPHRRRSGIRGAFIRLVEIRNDLAHGLPPRDASGWQALFEESFGLLREVLGRFTFLKDYELVRILDGGEEDTLLEVYQGLEVRERVQPLPPKRELMTGWFYLSQREGRFLRLYPMLVFWEVDLVECTELYSRDAAIFDRFRRSSLDYLATVVWERCNLDDDRVVAEFFRVVFDTIRQVDVEHRRGQDLDWQMLKEVFPEITADRSGDICDKYRSRLYLQRAAILQHFKAFLASDKTGLVLIGKSGVGKSSFLLSLLDRYQNSPEVCAMMYNAAHLGAEIPLTDIWVEDLSRYTGLRASRDVLSAINQIEDMENKRVVVFIDGLNENPAASRLLERIDGFANAYPYRWLKVVVSSRPETWRSICRGVQLATHRYYHTKEGKLEVEMPLFAEDELLAAYVKYRKEFELKTDYEQLSARIQHMLRDPFTLWLFAEAYRDRAVPSDVRVGTLYQDYIDALLRTGRLRHPEDLHFLKSEMVPLMIKRGTYSNRVTDEIIDEERTADGKSLFELIHSNEILSSGRRVNESFANLCDAQILTMQAQIRTYEVSFQHEGFYEFFGGKQLFEVHKQDPQTDKEKTYRDLMIQVDRKPFLWGVLKRALQLEMLGSQDADRIEQLDPAKENLIEQLCHTDNQLSQDLLVATLSEFGASQKPDLLDPLLQRLLDSKESEQAVSATQRIGIRAARRLGRKDILFSAVISPLESVRAIASQELYYLWRDDRPAGEDVLRRAGQEVRGRFGLPQGSVLESCLILSLLIMLGHSEEQEALELLREIWRDILQDLHIVSRRKGPLSILVREAAISLVFNLVTRLMRASAAEVAWAMPVTLPEIAAFFDLYPEEKTTFRDLLPFLDPERTDIQDAIPLLQRIGTHRDVLSMLLINIVLTCHVRKSPEAVVDAIELLTEIALNMLPAGPAVTYSRLALLGFNDLACVFTPEMAEKLVEIVERTYRRTGGWYRTATGSDYLRTDVSRSTIIYNHHCKHQPKFVEEYLDELLQSSPLDMKRLEQFTGLAADFAVESDYHNVELRPTLELYDLLLNKARMTLGPTEDQVVRALIVEALAWLWVYYPEDVEKFLAAQPDFESERIETLNKARERTGDLLGRYLANFATQEAVHDRYRVRRDIIWLLEQATVSKSAARWFSLLAKWLINTIYGETLFDLGMPHKDILARPNE